MSTLIDSRAVVDPGAELDSSVKVGPFAVIGAGVRIGKGTEIGPHVVLRGPTDIGEDCRIFQFASVGEDPQDKKYSGEPTRLEIGDRTVIRESATVHRGTTQDQGVTRVGSDCLLMAYTHVAHDCVIGDNVILANAASLGGHVKVQEWVILGGFTIVHQFCQIGAHSFAAMGSAISKDVPPYVTVGGHPAKPHGINSEGLSRRGYSSEAIAAIKRAYKALYLSQLKLAEAIDEIEFQATDYAELLPMVEFLRGNQRSIVR